LDCLTCPANGDCELQDMAGVVGLREVRYGYEGEPLQILDEAYGQKPTEKGVCLTPSSKAKSYLCEFGDLYFT